MHERTYVDIFMAELLVQANTQNLKQVFSFINNAISSCGLTPKTHRQIKLCVEEIFINIVNYAYKDYNDYSHDKQNSIVKINVDIINDDYIQIVFTDYGKPFNPLNVQEPDVSLDIEHRKSGGLGIFLVKHVMDSIEYKYEDGTNILTLKKQFVAGANNGL